MLDTPVPGPADLFGIGVIVVGSLIVWGAYEKSKGNPGDLEKGMTQRQKKMYKQERDDWKESHGMHPDDNLPWEILCMLAAEVRKMFK
jgi:hypothetical protein